MDVIGCGVLSNFHLMRGFDLLDFNRHCLIFPVRIISTFIAAVGLRIANNKFSFIARYAR
jgi:hypothetical protein